MTLSSIVTRPKSSATVVVVFWLPEPGRSIPIATVVIAASVVSGSISDRAPTNVVLPTPKPPDTTIFTGTGGSRPPPAHPDGEASRRDRSECRDTVDEPFQEPHVESLARP